MIEVSVKPEIKTSAKIEKICKAMADVQPKLQKIKKTGYNKSQSYNYSKLEDYIESIMQILPEHGLFITCSQGAPHRLEVRETKLGGKQYPVQISTCIRLNHESGEFIEILAYGEGQDSGDKAIYKAITGSRKYGIACLLNLVTTDNDDPEYDGEEPNSKVKSLRSRNYTNSSETQVKNNLPKVDKILQDFINEIKNITNLKTLEEKKEIAKKQLIVLKSRKDILNNLRREYEKRKIELNKLEVPA